MILIAFRILKQLTTVSILICIWLLLPVIHTCCLLFKTSIFTLDSVAFILLMEFRQALDSSLNQIGLARPQSSSRVFEHRS